MSESLKTISFVAIAGVLVGLAFLSHYSSLPSNSADFELVGKPFFEAFDSASAATSLEVAAMDPESGELRRFSVKNEKGLWRIPSHYNYPAEAVDRLAKTAASVMGIEREALEGRLATEHERLGVVDPLGDDIEDPESVGQRITLKDQNGEPLVDLIIGNEVEDDPIARQDEDLTAIQTEPLKTYYVRRPDENQTYKVGLNIDLSTRFSDWIDPDLLQLDRNRLNKIVIDNYSFEESGDVRNRTLVKVQGDQADLTRENPSAPWGMEELDAATKQVNNIRLNEIISGLTTMKISGVRPKFKYKDQLLLTPDLKLNQQPEFNENRQEFAAAIQRLQAELERRGFSLAGSTAAMELVSQKGEISVGTNEGILYHLHVGNPVEGTDEEIEVGGTSDSTSQSESSDSPPTSADSNAEDNQADSDEAVPAEEAPDAEEPDARNRYLMIRVEFAENLVADQPQKPIQPIKPLAPEGYTPPGETESDPDQASSGDADVPDDVESPDKALKELEEDEKSSSDSEQDPDNDAKQEQDDSKSDQQESDTPARKPEFVAYDQALAEYEQKQTEYNVATLQYEEDLKAFQERVEAGKQRVAELNQRFGDWYYVITADNLKTLQSNREDLIEDKPPEPAGAPGQPPGGIPGLQGGLPPGISNLMRPPAGVAPQPKQDTPDNGNQNPATDASEDDGKESDSGNSEDKSNSGEAPSGKENPKDEDPDQAASKKSEGEANGASDSGKSADPPSTEGSASEVKTKPTKESDGSKSSGDSNSN